MSENLEEKWAGKIPTDEEMKEALVGIEPQESTDVSNPTNLIETDSSDDDFESGEGLLTDATYDVPDIADKFVDTKDGTVIDKKDLTPFQMIKAIAKQNNHTIKDPSKSCKKCYGRGYESMDTKTKMPIPCRCLFRGKSAEEKEADLMYDSKNNPGKISRTQKRRMQRVLLNQFNFQKKLIRKITDKKENESVEQTDEQTDEQKKAYIDNIVKTYEEVKSLKKASKKLNITLTELKKIIKIVRDSESNKKETETVKE